MSPESEKAPQYDRPPSDELLRLINESVVDFAIFSVGPTGLVTSWNIGAERLLGYEQDEILGKTADVIFPSDEQQAAAAERHTASLNGRAEDERWQVRKDGSRFWASGLLMRLADSTQGFVKILRDQTLKHNAEASVSASEERFRLLATNIPQLVFVGRFDGQRTWPSPQWIQFTGLSSDASLGLGWLDAIHPDDRDDTLRAWMQAEQSGEYYVEHRIREAATGSYRWHQTRARPIEGREARTSDWIGTMTDIDDLRNSQSRQQVILGELQHRTRNLLALVQAIARQTLRGSDDTETLLAKFNDRLRALSRVQAIVGGANGKPIYLRDLLYSELEAQAGGVEEGKVSLHGPDVALPPASAQALGLAIHELATNAVKYGALRQDAAKLNLEWAFVSTLDERWIELEWTELGVDLSGRDSSRKGYGSELIERALPYQLDARTHLEFGASGVRCTIAVPIGNAIAVEVE